MGHVINVVILPYFAIGIVAGYWIRKGVERLTRPKQIDQKGA